MRRLEWLAHISLDGYVAGRNGELDGFEASDENLGFVCDLAEDADTAVLGRISYQLLEGFWPAAMDRPGATKNEIRYSKWYNSATKLVASHSLKSIGSLQAISGDIAGEIRSIKERDGKALLLFGSPSIATILAEEDLIDSFWIFFNPVVFGAGVPLFNGSVTRKKLKLVATRKFMNGEMAFNYNLESTG